MIPYLNDAFFQRLKSNIEAAKVREWILKRVNGNENLLLADLYTIAALAADTPMLSSWERATAKDRKRRANSIAYHARKLADLLSANPRPPVPSLLGMLSEPKRQSIIDRALNDAGLPHKSMEQILEALAYHAEHQLCHKRPRISRPNIDSANANIFARELEAWFLNIFGEKTDEIIADCVALLFPDIDPRPDSDTIKNWRQDWSSTRPQNHSSSASGG